MVGGCVVASLAAALWLRGMGAPAPVRDRRGDAAQVENTPAANRPTLWLLAIGVSRYKEADIALQFADADARAMAAALEQQGRGPIYREAKTLVLTNEEVTRESILGGIERFLGQAGPDDVAAIFLAGHGVQDRATGTYYFLPYPANGSNLLTDGLRMSDFDEMIRVLRRNVRRVVVMLDTCHSGALRLASARAVPSADDLAVQVSLAEGLFLLAATKPGEDSTETPELAHGAFTYSLLQGLRGDADADGDGLLSVSELFGYVASHVPRLTEGRQHPYHKSEGTDLTFAAVTRSAEAAEPAPLPTSARPLNEPVATLIPNAIAVMEFRNLRRDAEHEWIGQALRAALDTELTKVRVLRVLSPDLIDRKRAEGLDDLRTARQLGISKLLTGTFAVIGDTIRIDASIVDAASGVHQGSDSVQGPMAEFFDLEKKLVLNILRRLTIDVSPSEKESIEAETNTTVNAYRLLLQAEGIADEPAAPTPKHTMPRPRTAPRGAKPGPQSRSDSFWGVAHAQEPADTDAEVRRFLEAYRRAHEQKDVDALAKMYVTFSARQHDGLRAYLDNADQLTVAVEDLTITPTDTGVTISFTRRDRFIDKATGKPARLEVHLTKTLVREDGAWKIAGGR
jgi:uncharacterized caspase-like protein/TolB-like protein